MVVPVVGLITPAGMPRTKSGADHRPARAQEGRAHVLQQTNLRPDDLLILGHVVISVPPEGGARPNSGENRPALRLPSETNSDRQIEAKLLEHAERLRQRLDDTVPGNLQGRQQLDTTRPHRSRVALAEIPTRQSPVSWYARKTADQSPKDPAHHADRFGSKPTISLWRYVETGLVPDGAVMAKTTPTSPPQRNPAAAFSGLPGQPGPGAGRWAARGYDWRLSRRQKVSTPSPRSSALCMQDCGKPSMELPDIS
jgi:hypothetical protein